MSKKLKDMKGREFLEDRDDEIIKTGSVKKVGIKTFYLENGVWVDSEFKETAGLTEVKLRFGEEKYFDLAASEKDLGQYLALGEQVDNSLEGKGLQDHELKFRRDRKPKFRHHKGDI